MNASLGSFLAVVPGLSGRTINFYFYFLILRSYVIDSILCKLGVAYTFCTCYRFIKAKISIVRVVVLLHRRKTCSGK